jgi:methyl-accepting chemotaxis protein
MAVLARRGGIPVEFQPMSPEEIERTVQFVLHSQARFEANSASLSEKTDRIAQGLVGLTVLADQTDRKVRELADSMGTVRDGLNALTGIVGRMSERVDQLGEGVDQRLDRVAEVQQRQSEAGERLDRRLGQIAKMQQQQAKAGERLDRRLDRLERSQERTDQQIKELGTHFKRHLRKNHGRPAS